MAAPSQSRLEGLTIGIWGRHELYAESLAALLASRGAEVELVEDLSPLGRARASRLHALLAEAPLPSELERLLALGPPVIVLAERGGRNSGIPPELQPSTVLAKSCTLTDLSLALRRAVQHSQRPGARDLTARQRDVLYLIAEGLDNAAIADRLGISERTARSHVSSVLRRLGVANRTQAAVTAVRRGWLAALLLVVLAGALIGSPVAAEAAGSDKLAARIGVQLRAAGGTSGAWVADSAGRQLYAYLPDIPRTPASVQKLLTTATALERLGPDVQLETSVSANGKLDEAGTLDGDLYLRGGGDPSFEGASLARLARQVEQAGIREVTGRVYGDETYFDARRGLPAAGFQVSSWVGPLSALAFNQGTLRGFGGGFQANPPLFAAQRLRAALEARGVEVGRAARAGRAPGAAAVVATVPSLRMLSLVRHTNQVSDNFFAEILLKGVGARFGAAGSTLAGAAIVRRMANDLGFSSRVLDGSGLSRGNAVSPRAVARLLLAAQQRPWFDSFYRSLPLAGRSGTLRKRMRGTPARGRCRAKTGTLIGVSALAGYCRAKSGRRTVFALLMNSANVWRARTAQDRIAAALAAY